jgi:hypothetical protein
MSIRIVHSAVIIKIGRDQVIVLERLKLELKKERRTL